MTDYVGEMLRVTHVATDFDGDALTPDDIIEVVVEIFNAAGDTVVAETAMAYDLDELLWYYLWTTTEDGTSPRLGGTPLPTGSYRAKVTLIDLDDHPAWEFIRIRLARSPVGG